MDYRIYVIPYVGSFDSEKDYSPYTSCGVMNAGYSVYTDEIGNEMIRYDPAQVEKDGYIEVTSNTALWGEAAKKGTVLYVTVLVGQVSYVGVLVGDSSMTVAALMSISIIVTIVIAIALFVVFWALFIRVKALKKQGYKPVVA